jgi:hypothetical protein
MIYLFIYFNMNLPLAYYLIVNKFIIMRSLFRLYANTSKSNDPFLYNELVKNHLTPKYDPHMHSFYFDANYHTLFDLSFKSFTIENLYIQIGKKFTIIGENNMK